MFNEWSINRILAGEKTQARRIVKPQPPDNADRVEVEANGTLGYFAGETAAFHDNKTCAYGQPGDVLWVREAFRMPVGCDGKYTPKEYISSSGYTQGVPGRFQYEADGKRACEVAGKRDACAVEWGRKRPPIHMPKELCRLRLRVEDVWVQRVQRIGNDDAKAEGIDPDAPVRDYTAREKFSHLWDDVHGSGAWERNDWVWVITFSRIDNA
jgi:hypothetical protein